MNIAKNMKIIKSQMPPVEGKGKVVQEPRGVKTFCRDQIQLGANDDHSTLCFKKTLL